MGVLARKFAAEAVKSSEFDSVITLLLASMFTVPRSRRYRNDWPKKVLKGYCCKKRGNLDDRRNETESNYPVKMYEQIFVRSTCVTVNSMCYIYKYIYIYTRLLVLVPSASRYLVAFHSAILRAIVQPRVAQRYVSSLALQNECVDI